MRRDFPKRIVVQRPVSWLRDVFPEMLWLLVATTTEDQRNNLLALARDTCRLCDDGEEPRERRADPRSAFTLTTVEGIYPRYRAALLAILARDGAYELVVPEDFARSMLCLAEWPGSWILDPWRQRGLTADSQVGEAFFASLLGRCSKPDNMNSLLAQRHYVLTLVRAGALELLEPMQPHYNRIFRFPDKIQNVNEYHDATKSVQYLAFAAWSYSFNDGNFGRWPQKFWGQLRARFPKIMPDLPEEQALSADLQDLAKFADEGYDVVTSEGIPLFPELAKPGPQSTRRKRRH